ncbi:MAG: hypothetical protein U0797_13055 [Gemmataceae bacterium]
MESGFLPVKAHNDLLHAWPRRGCSVKAAYALLPAALLVSLARAWRAGERRDWVVAARRPPPRVLRPERLRLHDRQHLG